MGKLDRLREMREKANPGKAVAVKKAKAKKTSAARLEEIGKSVPPSAWKGFPEVAGRRVGRPRLEDRESTLAATKPWVALGMSRRSWFRRQKEQRSKG